MLLRPFRQWLNFGWTMLNQTVSKVLLWCLWPMSSHVLQRLQDLFEKVAWLWIETGQNPCSMPSAALQVTITTGFSVELCCLSEAHWEAGKAPAKPLKSTNFGATIFNAHPQEHKLLNGTSLRRASWEDGFFFEAKEQSCHHEESSVLALCPVTGRVTLAKSWWPWCVGHKLLRQTCLLVKGKFKGSSNLECAPMFLLDTMPQIALWFWYITTILREPLQTLLHTKTQGMWMHQNASKCAWSSAACFSFRQKYRLQQPLIREPSAEGISGVSTKGVKNLSTGM